MLAPQLFGAKLSHSDPRTVAAQGLRRLFRRTIGRVPLPSPAVNIHVLSPAQVPAALHLSTEAGWNQREEDWRAAVEMTPGRSFCAVVDGVLVGTCIGISYSDFSWIAMMLVDPGFRRHGLGAGLLLRTIAALPPNRPIGLDATAVGRLLYQQHGFHETCMLARWVADHPRFDQTEDADDDRVTIQPIDASAMRGIVPADRDVFGGDRRRVLEWAESREPGCCAIAAANGELAGYVFGRRGRVFSHLGSVVARSRPIAQALVRYVGRTASRPLGIDAFDGCPGWNEWLAASGFVLQRPLVRMKRPPLDDTRATIAPARGRTNELRAFSIFGPEFA
jgi:GNAT superfamily N-acetyltransferase